MSSVFEAGFGRLWANSLSIQCRSLLKKKQKPNEKPQKTTTKTPNKTECLFLLLDGLEKSEPIFFTSCWKYGQIILARDSMI